VRDGEPIESQGAPTRTSVDCKTNGLYAFSMTSPLGTCRLGEET